MVQGPDVQKTFRLSSHTPEQFKVMPRTLYIYHNHNHIKLSYQNKLAFILNYNCVNEYFNQIVYPVSVNKLKTIFSIHFIKRLLYILIIFISLNKNKKSYYF